MMHSALLQFFVVLGLLISSPYVVASNAPLPWQSGTSTAAGSSDIAYFADLPHTTFAPGGRLLKVEAAQAAAATDPGSNLLIALNCGDNGMVLVSSVPRSPYLFDFSSVETKDNTAPCFPLWRMDDDNDEDWITAPFCKLSKHGIVATTVGNVVDSHVARHVMLSFAESFDEEYALELHEPSALARRLADEWQVQTQTIRNGRILASSAVICSHDSLWRIEPTGQFFECAAVVAGKAAAKAQANLLERLAERAELQDKKIESTSVLENVLSQLSSDEAVNIAAECIRDTLKSILTKAASTDLSEKQELNPVIRMACIVIQNGHIRKVKLAT